MSYIFNLFQVDSILRANEYYHEFSEGSVKAYDSNQLASNNPIEDTRSEASCLLTTGKSSCLKYTNFLLDAIDLKLQKPTCSTILCCNTNSNLS